MHAAKEMKKMGDYYQIFERSFHNLFHEYKMPTEFYNGKKTVVQP